LSAAYKTAFDAFEVVNNERRRIEEEARQKQLEKQRNEIFNGAYEDFKLFDLAKENFSKRVEDFTKTLADI
jgi:hypothetical protein